jgi:multiple sugar transport system substrate-binding protein
MRTKLLFLLTILSLIAAACAAPATPAPQPTAAPATQAPQAQPTTAPAAQPVTIRMMVVDYIPDKTDTWLEQEVVPAFQKEHPHINVEFIYVSWGTLDETIQGYFAAGEGADILNLGSEYIAEYGDRLAPLNAYLGQAAWPDIRQFVPGSLDTVTWEGELRGLPWLTAPRAYMCRTDLLQAAGVEGLPTTFADAIEAAGKTTVIEGGAVKRAGLVTTGRLDDWQEYVQLIWGLGGQLYHANGMPAFDTREAEAALQFMYDRRRAVYPDETTADLPEAQGSRLVDGTAACLWANMWGAPPAADPIWDKIELSASPVNPTFPNSKPVSQVFNDWLAVANYSKHVAEAAEFLKFLGSADNLFRYNQDFGSFPPRKDAWKGYVTDSELMQTLGSLMDQYGVGFADVRETARFREILQKEMSAYFTDLQDLDTTLANIQQQYTQVLRDAGRISGN